MSEVITDENGQDRVILGWEEIAEMYEEGKVKYLGDKKINGSWWAIYESKRLPLRFYAVQAMQLHSPDDGVDPSFQERADNYLLHLGAYAAANPTPFKMQVMRRLMDEGASEREAKMAIDFAMRDYRS